MKRNFTLRQIEDLCNLYLEGQLSRKEENMLRLILKNARNLPEEGKKTLRIMDYEEKIFTFKKERKTFSWRYSPIAASILILIAFTIPFFGDYNQDVNEESFTVWQDGRKITGEEARKIAEENQKENMEMMRQIMKQQRELLKRNFAAVNMEDYDL